MIDQLAQEYAQQQQPVVFLEYNSDTAPYSRESRWWAAYPGGSTTLPRTMVDSGQQISTGYLDFYTKFKSMVETSRQRPAQAAIQAYWERMGNRVHFWVRLTNQSGKTLSFSGNKAEVHAIVYENNHVQLTDRFMRQAISTGIGQLASGASADYDLETSDLSGVDWGKLHFLVLVDYRPGGSSGPFDMLQAAEASPLAVTIGNPSLTFFVDMQKPSIRPQALQLTGPGYIRWTASTPASWILLSRTSGTIADGLVISVNLKGLHSGWQAGAVAIQIDNEAQAREVKVQAYLGLYRPVFMPSMQR